MTAPAPDKPRRAMSTHFARERQDRGVVSAAMANDHSRPIKATGTPAITDHELVVTAVQLMIPVSGHARAVGSV
jgi:hypothetical protein